MKPLRRTSLLAAALLSIFALRAVAQTPATTAFTYQGRLMDNGASPTALYDLQFKLFDALTLGNQVGSTVVLPSVQMTGGLFTVSLDFGAQFNSQARWLHIGVRPAGGTTFTALVPRQPITAAPEANGIVLPLAATTGAASSALTLTNTVGGGLSATGAGNGIDCLSTGVNANGISAMANNGPLAYGVWGRSSTGYGVVGGGTSGAIGGAFGSDTGIGLIGQSTSSHGIYGENGNGSGRHPLLGYGAGVWGDTDNGNGVAGTSGTAYGVYGLSGAVSGIVSPGTAGVYGESHGHIGVVGLSSTSIGVSGYSSTSHGIYGRNGAGSGITPLFGYTGGVWGDSDNGHGLIGTSGTGFGIYGALGTPTGLSPSGSAVVGDCSTGTGIAGLSTSGTGVYGTSDSGSAMYATSTSGVGVNAFSGTGSAVYGRAGGASGFVIPFQCGIWGDSNGTGTTFGVGVLGTSSNGFGVYGKASHAGSAAVYGEAAGAGVLAGYFIGPVQTSDDLTVNGSALIGVGLNVIGHLSKGSGSFKIDHPLDPENKYLYHSFVESPDMMNIYDGTVTTDAKGYATIIMPDWFQALNRDFHYQLTVVNEAHSDEFVQVMVVRKLHDNQFTIRSSSANTEVSWQVTGIRQDAYANAHRIPVEEYKPDGDRGLYLYPTEQNQPKERGINWRKLNLASQPRVSGDAASSTGASPSQPDGTTARATH